MVIGALTNGITCFRVGTLPETCTTMVFGTDGSFIVRVDISVDAFVRAVSGVVPDVGISADVDANTWEPVMAVLEFITLSASLEELLLFCRTALCIAVLGCRALQPWIPSNHVCGNFLLPEAPQFPNQEPP